MKMCNPLSLAAGALVVLAVSPSAQVRGWPTWRGPDQNGTSRERGLPSEVSLAAGRGWTYRLSGRGTPVVYGGRVYALGYEGERKELQEVLVCLDERTGKRIWEHRFTDFLSDIVYYRYSIGAPTVDVETGNVYCMSSAGLLTAFSRDGKQLWQHSMMSEYGRMTFPNGRTGAVLVDGDLAIVHGITTSWGPQAPARDRFYAFDKSSGEPIWSSTPGGPPKDSSFGMPVLGWEHGRRVMYAGLGGGHLVCVDVRTGAPVWRYAMAIGGLSSSAVLYGDTVIAIHGKQDIDSSRVGRMVAVRCGAQPEPGKGPVDVGRDHEVWRNDLCAFTSSPVLAGNRVYETVATGDLCCVDADNGHVLWQEKLAPDQIHASPVWGDGKLYVPMNNGTFFIVRPSDERGEILQKVQLEGNCLGAPAIAGGRIFVHTTARLYCFTGGPSGPAGDTASASALQVIPGDIVLQQGDHHGYRVRSIDGRGAIVAPAVQDVSWGGALGRGVAIDARGMLTVAPDAAPRVGMVTAKAGELTGAARLRIVPAVPFHDDFEDIELHPSNSGVAMGPGRPYWVCAGRKWEVLELDGSKVLARNLDNPLFQRTMSLIGHPAMHDYTMQVDVRAGGNRRIMASVGLVNQRYLIVLKGNHQQLEVSSNEELLKEGVPFHWKPGVWYRLKTRVDVADDGSGVIRAKAWPREEPEPAAWTIEVSHPHAHTHGSPGLYGFTPQSRVRAYLDNISVTANE